jgi:hypothetical protein
VREAGRESGRQDGVGKQCNRKAVREEGRIYLQSHRHHHPLAPTQTCRIDSWSDVRVAQDVSFIRVVRTDNNTDITTNWQ